MWSRLRRVGRLSLAGQFLVLQLAVLVVVVAVGSVVSVRQGDADFRDTRGARLLATAESLASTDAVREAMEQRDNRAAVAELAKGKSMIDAFCHTGGLGVTAAAKGAASVTFVDSSAKALENARQNAALNKVDGKCAYVAGKAFDVMQKMAEEGKTFDVVAVDPPTFIKARREMHAGLKGYQKLAKLAAPLVAKGGYLFFASCSHHASVRDLTSNVSEGLRKAGRTFELVKTTGAAHDHPVHYMLAETGYLKALTFKMLD